MRLRGGVDITELSTCPLLAADIWLCRRDPSALLQTSATSVREIARTRRMIGEHEPDLLTPRETAERLRVGPATVRSYGAAGRLDVVRLNTRTYRYTRESVEALMTPDQTQSNVVAADAEALPMPSAED